MIIDVKLSSAAKHITSVDVTDCGCADGSDKRRYEIVKSDI